MTNQMLVFGGNHNGINCIQNNAAERPCDKVWFTEAQICEWSSMSHSTLWRRLKKLEEVGRILPEDISCVDIPISNGGSQSVSIYNRNVLNQLAIIAYMNDKLNDVYKQVNDLSEDYTDTDSLHYLQHPIYHVAENVTRYSLRLENVFGCMLEDTLKSFNLTIHRQYLCGKYKIDFYIPEINVCIEYDEHDHVDYDQTKEHHRLKYIQEQLNCNIIHVSDANSHSTNVGIVLRELI